MRRWEHNKNSDDDDSIEFGAAVGTVASQPGGGGCFDWLELSLLDNNTQIYSIRVLFCSGFLQYSVSQVWFFVFFVFFAVANPSCPW